ncbi:hypothetical protein EVA_15385 [gut metagenome]|uniref:Uncharacterized protein n=1 Tax=gut metagenome TaxID=749906 RepID=J9FNI9_9ZZZZ
MIVTVVLSEKVSIPSINGALREVTQHSQVRRVTLGLPQKLNSLNQMVAS